MIRVLTTALVFAFLFPPFVEIGGRVLHLPYLVALLLASWPLFQLLRGGGLSRRYIMFIASFLVGYAWILGISILRGVVDWSLQVVYVNGFLTLLAAYGLAHILHTLTDGSPRRATDTLVDAVFGAGVIHGSIMAAAFFFPPFSRALYSVVVLGTKGQIFVEQLIRAPGLTTGGGDALSVIQAIALVFGIHRYWQRAERTVISGVLHLIAFAILLLSILLSGRTGFVVLGLGILLLALHEVWRWAVRARIRRSALAAGVVATVAIAIAVPAVIGFVQRSPDSPTFGRALEPVHMLMQTGRFATESTDRILGTMYFLPESELDLLVGTGNFGRDSNLPQLPSDVGYVRTIFGAGIIGTVLIYLALLFPLIAVRGSPRADGVAILLLVFVIGSILVVNVKVFHFAGMRESFKVLALLTAFCLMSHEGSRGREARPLGVPVVQQN